MRSEMPLSVRDSLIQSALDAGSREICGFILKDWTIVFMPNSAEGDGEFRMDDLSLMEFYNGFPQPLGMFHSHPKGRQEPSDSDVDYAPIGLRYWIITPREYEIIEWNMNNGKPERIAA